MQDLRPQIPAPDLNIKLLGAYPVDDLDLMPHVFTSERVAQTTLGWSKTDSGLREYIHLEKASGAAHSISAVRF